MSIPAGWYTDSTTPGQLRWWDGSQWTEHVTAGSAPVEAQADTSAQTVAYQAQPVPVPAQAPAAHDPYVNSITQTTQSFDYAPQPEPGPKRTGLWIGLGAGALVLVLAIGAGIFFVGSRVVGSLTDGLPTIDQGPVPTVPDGGSGPGTDDDDAVFDDVSAQLMDPVLPLGFAPDPESPPSGSDTAATWWSYAVDSIEPPECTPLAAYEPLLTTDGSASDVVTDLGSWLGPQGSVSLTGSVRQFTSAAEAEDFIVTTTSTIAACGSGYSGDGFVTQSVTATGFDPSADSLLSDSWLEAGENITDGEDPFPWAYEVADIQRGNLVVRGTCFQSADIADAAVCSEFFAALAADLDAL